MIVHFCSLPAFRAASEHVWSISAFAPNSCAARQLR
jgi:hypothetical protein